MVTKMIPTVTNVTNSYQDGTYSLGMLVLISDGWAGILTSAMYYFEWFSAERSVNTQD